MDIRTARTRVVPQTVALLAAALLAGCAGTGSAADGPPTAGGGASSATVATGTASPSGTGSPGGSGTGSATGSATPGGTAGSGSPAVSKVASFEADPAVKALRLYYLGAAKAVNAKSWNQPELKAGLTKAWYKYAERFFSDEYGDYYPGPIPFGVVSVVQTAPTRKQVVYCVLGDGWLQDPKTRRPTLPRKVGRLVATVVRQGSTWRVDDAVITGGSCAGVSMREEPFR